MCYRTKLAAPIELRDAMGGTLVSNMVDIINPLDTRGVSVERAFLVEKVTKLMFDQGVLVGVAIRKPSEYQAASLLPVNVISALLSAPVGMLGSIFHGSSAGELELAKKIGDQNRAAGQAFAAAQPQSVGRIGAGSDATFQILCSSDEKSLLFRP